MRSTVHSMFLLMLIAPFTLGIGATQLFAGELKNSTLNTQRSDHPEKAQETQLEKPLTASQEKKSTELITTKSPVKVKEKRQPIGGTPRIAPEAPRLRKADKKTSINPTSQPHDTIPAKSPEQSAPQLIGGEPPVQRVPKTKEIPRKQPSGKSVTSPSTPTKTPLSNSAKQAIPPPIKETQLNETATSNKAVEPGTQSAEKAPSKPVVKPALKQEVKESSKTMKKDSPKSVEKQGGATVKRENPQAGDIKQKVIEHLRSQLQSIDAQIKQLRDKSSDIQVKGKESLYEQLESLKGQKDAILPQIDKLRQSGEDAWKDMKEGINKAIEELKQAINQVTTY